MKCIIHFEETCWEPEPEQREMGYRLIATIEEICSEETLLHAGKLKKYL